MKSGRTQVEIIALYEELGSYRAVGALMGCDHKTVKRYVEASLRVDAFPKALQYDIFSVGEGASGNPRGTPHVPSEFLQTRTVPVPPRPCHLTHGNVRRVRKGPRCSSMASAW